MRCEFESSDETDRSGCRALFARHAGNIGGFVLSGKFLADPFRLSFFDRIFEINGVYD
jgi:hypothetical protein